MFVETKNKNEGVLKLDSKSFVNSLHFFVPLVLVISVFFLLLIELFTIVLTNSQEANLTWLIDKIKNMVLEKQIFRRL